MTLPPMFIASAGMPVKDISGTWQAFMGIPMADQADAYRTIADFGKAPADEAWVYRCVTLKAMFAQSVPLRVYVRDGKQRIPAEDSGASAAIDLQYLLDNVNPVNMNGGDLKAFTNAALSVWGENYVRKVRGRLGGPPQELWWLRAPDITPNKGRVWIDTYTYTPQGALASLETYQPRDIIAQRRLNLQEPMRGLSPLSAIRFDINFGRNMSEQRAQRVSNWSTPPGAWVVPGNSTFSGQDRRLVERILARLRGPKGAGKVPVLPAGMTWQQIGLNSRDAEDIANGKVSRMAVCAALGVPLVLAGDDEKTSVYRNMVDAERVFSRYMIGELDWTADTYNGWLVPDFDPTGKRLVVAFDYSQIEALQAPLEDRKRVAISEVQTGIRTRNEYRAEFRTGPKLADGDALVQLNTLLPVDAPAPQAPDVETTAPAQEQDADTDVSTRDWRAIARDYKDTGDITKAASFLGVAPTDALREGMRRRYSMAQLLDGVPAERYAGLRTRL